MQNTRILVRRVVLQLQRLRAPTRTFVSGTQRSAVGTGPAMDEYKGTADTKKRQSEHPKNDDSLPNFMEEKLGEKEASRGAAGFGSGGKSHATGESIVPEAVQKVAPEKLEKALPEALHPMKGSEIDPDPQRTGAPDNSVL